MRRTYRSKKDTAGGLDHKDVLLTLDERSSAFDAYYIQKLKQTKRELSSMGASSQYAIAPSKVRKKKFVKRIVKEVENAPGEAMSQSTYLTPDKSIRVNKGQDLFDQLLNKSSPHQLEPKLKEDDLFDKVRAVRPAMTYGTRKARKVKKYNYSSSESESDKENESSDISTNVTDIRAHKLIVEQDGPNSPKYQDESISKIVQNLSIFNNINCFNDSSGSPVISFSKNINRKRTKPATQQLQSTVLEKSVLNSTPFKNIRTATSIFMLSPISRVSCDASPNYVTIVEESNEKVVIDDIKSPLVKKPTHNIFNVDTIDDSDISVIKNNKTEPELNKINEESVKEAREGENLDCVSVLSDSFNDSDMHISLGGSKPSEVLLGFTATDNEVEELKRICEIIDVSRIDNDKSMNVKAIDSFDCSELEVSSRESKLSEPFCGFAVDDEQNDNQADCSQIFHKISETDTSTCNTSANSQNAASFYDTCSSESDDSKLSIEVGKEPIINLTRMDDEYYNKMTTNSSDHSSVEVNDEHSESSSSQEDNSSNSRHNYLQSDNVDMLKNNEETDSDDLSNPDEHIRMNTDNSKSEIDEDSVLPQDSENESDLSIFDDLESNSNDDEVRCFVNTRRKVTFKSNSNRLSSNDSSSNSSECNMTIISNKVILHSPNNDRKTDQNNLITSNEGGIDNKGVSYEENYLHGNEIDFCSQEIEEMKEANTRDSFITTRKSSRKWSVSPNSPDCSMEMDKPAIVLQPGKKWERSLSIYRRMTMMNDHFDKSLLDDEPLNCKGRNYRQSVISTMEMQEGSQHNESISSRRSTFVAKPCRSTIVIIKEPNKSRTSLCNTTVYDDLRGNYCIYRQ